MSWVPRKAGLPREQNSTGFLSSPRFCSPGQGHVNLEGKGYTLGIYPAQKEGDQAFCSCLVTGLPVFMGLGSWASHGETT